MLVLVCVLVLGLKGNDTALDDEKLDVYRVTIEFVEHEHANEHEHGAT